MGEFSFWSTWYKSDRAYYLSFLVIFFLSICYFLISYFLGTDAVIDWIIISSAKTVNVISEGANLAGISLNYNVDNLIITESFEGSEIRINFLAANLFLALILLSFVFYLSVITTLSRFWFLVGGAIFMFMMVSLKIDQLVVFGSYKNIPLYFIFAVYLPLLYYFHAFATRIKLVWRLMIFTVVTLAIGVVIVSYAEVNNPLLYLVNYGIVFPIIVSILFTISVAFEVVIAFLVVTTRGNNLQSKNSLTHFSVITLIYLVNLALVYAKNRQFINWDIFYINEFVLLLISALIGIWGFKHRSSLFENFLPFKITGALIYLVAAVICFATIGYLFATGNDPLVETMEDAIVFSHLSFGLFFYLYVISNFVGLLHDNQEVYKVVYKPQKMPYYVMRFVGLVGLGALFFESGQLALNQSIAGYYNGIGDLHTAVKNKQFAEQYYRLGSQFEFQNHRSNYGLASLAVENKDYLQAVRYYKQSTLKKPTPYAFANLANLYQEAGLYFDALFSLKEGLRSFPDNPYLNNNIALLYAKTDVLDSTLYYLNLALLGKETKSVAETNLIGVLVGNETELNIDSLNLAYQNFAYLPVKNNLLVLSNLHGKNGGRLFDQTLLSDSVLNPNTYTYLYNGLINNKYARDTTLYHLASKFLAKPNNAVYSEKIQFASAINDYNNGNVAKAFNSLNILKLQNSSLAGLYANLLGLWALQQNAPLLARDYFEDAAFTGFPEAEINLGFALLQMDSIMEAGNKFASVKAKFRNQLPEFLNQLFPILENGSVTIDSLSDQEKYWYLFLHKSNLSHDVRSQILEGIDNTYFTILAKIDWFDYQLDKHFDDTLNRGFEVLDNAFAADKVLSKRWESSKMDWLIKKKDWNEAQVLLQTINSTDRLRESYLQAKVKEADNIKAVEGNYRFLCDKNPFRTSYVIDAAHYFQEVLNDEQLAYETLLTAYKINSYSVPLSKAFVLQCVNMGLSAYAAEELQQLKTLTNYTDYQQFYNLYKAGVAKKEKDLDW